MDITEVPFNHFVAFRKSQGDGSYLLSWTICPFTEIT